MCSGWDSRTLACVDSVSYHKSGSNRPCMHFPTSSARVCMYTCLSVEEIAANGWLPWKMLQNGIWEAVWKCFTVVSGCSSAWCWKGRRVLSCIVEGRGRECANPHFLSLPWYVTELHMWERAILHQPASQDPHWGEHPASSCIYNLWFSPAIATKLYTFFPISSVTWDYSLVLPIVQLSCIYCSISCIDLLLATDLG